MRLGDIVKKASMIVLVLLLTGVMVSCGRAQSGEKTALPMAIYYLNKEETKLIREDYTPEAEHGEELLQEMIFMLTEPAEDLDLRSPMNYEFTLTGYTLEDKQLTLNFDGAYKKLPSTTEVLIRAALVRTLTQVKEVEYVAIQVEEEPLADSYGKPLGLMTADMFIDNAGKEINSYEKMRLRLYFANETGDGLIPVDRSVVYNSNISVERLVVEQIIGGPVNQETYPTINPQTGIVSITTRDNICYVNLDNNFLTQAYSVTSEVAIYSLVNSLVEIENVNKVQITIDGESNVMFRDNMNLTTVFERNLEILEDAE